MTRTETSALAGRILVREGFCPSASASLEPLMRASEKLRESLTRFMGSEGYSALLTRALARASLKAPSLSRMCLNPGGTLELRTEDAGQDPVLEAAVASVSLIEEIMELLIIFIGAPLTQTFVEGIWPDVFRPESSNETKGGT
jgi:hypothetical protein